MAFKEEHKNRLVTLKELNKQAIKSMSAKFLKMSHLCYITLRIQILEGKQLELQIRGSIEDNSKIIFLFLSENMLCPSLESPQRDGSNDGSQNIFLWRNMATYT